MRLALGSDHAGLGLRGRLAKQARQMGHECVELEAPDGQSYDYPVASDAVCEEVLAGRADYGILVCGTGIGVCIRANRHKSIRAANCTSTEMARLAREHNRANVLCLGARIMEEGQALEILRVFLETEQDPSERHERRTSMLDRNTWTPGSVRNGE